MQLILPNIQNFKKFLGRRVVFGLDKQQVMHRQSSLLEFYKILKESGMVLVHHFRSNLLTPTEMSTLIKSVRLN